MAVPQLKNQAAAGCYKLNFSVELLCDVAKEADFVLFDGDLKGIKGKKNVLNALSEIIEFPDEFASNWDALVDALCDLSWQAAPGYVLLLRNMSATLGLSANDREIAQDIFDDTVVYWRQRNKPFWIFFA
ncbi:MAG: barstar family protein [Gallionella sp.]